MSAPIRSIDDALSLLRTLPGFAAVELDDPDEVRAAVRALPHDRGQRQWMSSARLHWTGSSGC